MLLVDDLAAGGTKNLRHTPRGLVTLRYTIERQVFNDTVRMLQPLSINLILFGNENWNFETNIVLFRAVQRYIQVTKRFNNI